MEQLIENDTFLLSPQALQPIEVQPGIIVPTTPQKDAETKSTALMANGVLPETTENNYAAERVRWQQIYLEMLVSHLPVVLFALNDMGIFTFAQGQGLEALQIRPEELIGVSAFELYQDFPTFLHNIIRALDGEAFSTVDHFNQRILQTQFIPLCSASGEVTSVLGIASDITESRELEDTLSKEARRFRAINEHISDLVLILDATGMYKYVSPSHQRILGYSVQQLNGTNIFEMLHPDDLPQAEKMLHDALQNSGTVVWSECRVRHASGSWVTIECVALGRLDDPDIAGIIVNARDITERATMEEMLRYQAEHDSLTELPNRTLFLERLKEAIQEAQHVSNDISLLMLDINRFKEINDTFGHNHGDQLLRQLGNRLQHTIGSAGTVARLGGDEFAILLPGIDEQGGEQVVHTLCKALEAPFTLADHPLQIDISIGATMYPAHGTDPLTLMRHGDTAMYLAKQSHETYSLYNVDHDRASLQRLTLVGALRNAIVNDELLLYYQPKVALNTGITSSVEALIRWQHPTLGFIPPDQFIPLAEQTGLINPLTRWVLEAALKQSKAWSLAGYELTIAVNLSTWNLRDSTLPTTIASLLQHYNVPTRLFRVELTESAVMGDTARALEVLEHISALGVKISVDDYGTGYSSLSYLKRLPVDELKIDRSFVQHVATIAADATIVQSTIALAHSLGLHVVAEGVEDLAAWNLLATLHCDLAQGYYMSRPLPPEQLTSWLTKSQQGVSTSK